MVMHVNNDRQQIAQRKSSNTVVSMRLDATFFYERGVKFLQRNDLKRALKAFRKTVEYEPKNPVNHCNLAGVLSELGEFEASNEILQHVLKEIDPTMAECQFYMANNYANLGNYENAEECVLRYLDASPEGEYVEDAQEMLTVLLEEFGGGKAYERWESLRKQDELQQAKRDGRHLLEQGHFEAAVEWLEGMIQRDPMNMAAHNNLSLAYYYTGQYDQAIELSERVLRDMPDNIHALCNLAVFSAQMGPKDRLDACVAQLKKIFPLHYDQAMKVGTTLGLVGEHEAAMRLFSRLTRFVDTPEPALLHSLAAAAANAGHLPYARKWWMTLGKNTESDLSKIAEYYLEVVNRAIAGGEQKLRVSYQYDLPLQAQFDEMKRRLRKADLSTWRQDPLLRASLYWGLRHGTMETRQAVIRAMALIPDEDAERAIRVFLKRKDLPWSLVASALFVLRRTGAKGTVNYFENGNPKTVRVRDIHRDIVLSVNPIWKEIWEDVEQYLRKVHRVKFISHAKKLWISFVEDAFIKNDVRIVKPEIWACAVVTAIIRQHEGTLTFKEAARQFEISVASLGKAVKRLADYAERP